MARCNKWNFWYCNIYNSITSSFFNFFKEPLEYFTSDATELLGQHNPPSNNFKSLVPSNDNNEVNLKSDYN